MRSASRWWIQLLLGLACAAVGALLTLRPFTSLGVLVVIVAVSFIMSGWSELASSEGTGMARLASGIGWIGAGILVVAWAGITIHAIAIVAGISMVAGGLGRVIDVVRRRARERAPAALVGIASVILGVLALSWPDVTVLVIALLVGPRTVLFGLGEVASALRRRRGDRVSFAERTPWGPRWLRTIGAIASLVLALALLAVSMVIHRSTTAPDAFYTAPALVPSKAGVLLRSEPFARGIPAGSGAWRILYTTTLDHGQPAVAQRTGDRPQRPCVGAAARGRLGARHGGRRVPVRAVAAPVAAERRRRPGARPG
jgi:uncharacterized membrane protein HdeD (DUF308 family)